MEFLVIFIIFANFHIRCINLYSIMIISSIQIFKYFILKPRENYPVTDKKNNQLIDTLLSITRIQRNSIAKFCHFIENSLMS